ncbi:MAG TPA: triple tyrosine motif-containing protein, partial [Gemmatimonadaceae bacterium]
GNRVVRVDGNSPQVFSKPQGLDVGNATALLPRGGMAWVGGERGLAHVASGRATPMLAEGDRSLRGVSGIVQRENGELWLNGADGVTRIPAEEVAHALRDTTYRVHVEQFDYRDGLDGIAPQIRPLPSAVEGPDGRVWFVTASSILWIDPRFVHRNALAPPIAITALEADGRVFSTDSTVVLPRRTTAMHIRYTALSLAIPERVHFRYQLDGADESWQDGGTRREVSYTNLGPGTYRFHLSASNDDGVWNRTGVALTVVIPPTFSQTRTFTLLCLVAGGMVLWLLFQIRQRSVLHAARARFDVTLAERTRIAQELHDTLLQSFLGITLQLHGVKRLLGTRPADATVLLSRTIRDADAAVQDARLAVWDIRSPSDERKSLAQSLADVAHEAIGDSPIGVTVELRGTPRPVSRELQSVVLRVGREALINAVKHAAPRTVQLRLTFENDALRLFVHDDGLGFTPENAEQSRAGGHWGLVGMRERAASAGGTFAVESVPGEGTTVKLILPLPAGAMMTDL